MEPVVACVRERRDDVDEDRRPTHQEHPWVEQRHEGPRGEHVPVPRAAVVRLGQPPRLRGVPHRVVDDLRGGLAQIAEEAVVERADPVLLGNQDPGHEEEVDGRRGRDDRAPASVAPEPDEDAQQRDGQREILFAEHGEDRGEGEHLPALVAGRPVREQQRADRDRIGVKELPREPLVRRVEEERRRERDPGPLRLQEVAREQEDRDRTARLGHDLDDEQRDRARTEPIQRREQDEQEVRVVPEELDAADRDERVVEPRDEPRALVVDAEVETERPEAVVPQHREPDELVAPRREEQGRERPRASPNSGSTRTTRSAGLSAVRRERPPKPPPPRPLLVLGEASSSDGASLSADGSVAVSPAATSFTEKIVALRRVGSYRSCRPVRPAASSIRYRRRPGDRGAGGPRRSSRSVRRCR